MVSIGLIKKKENVLIAQCFQSAIMGIGNLILGGVTGFVTNLVTIVRNLVTFKREFTLPLKLAFIAFFAIMCAFVNQQGIIGWLPTLAAIIFTWFLDTKSDLTLKIVILVTMVMWLVFDLTIQNYTASFFDVLTLISNTIGLIRIKKDN